MFQPSHLFRWNDRLQAEITPEMLEDIPRAEKTRLYTFTHLFRGKRLIWQSILQVTVARSLDL